MALQFSFLLLGLVLLTAGAEALVRGGASLARRLGLAPLVVGLTVVAFGTSAPEMVVSVSGTLQGHGELAVGNVVGSNIFNVGVILGITALIVPIRIQAALIKIHVPLLIAVSVLAACLIGFGALSRLAGAVLLLCLAGYTALSIRLARKPAAPALDREFEEGVPGPTRSPGIDVLLILGGLGLLVLGAWLLVGAATVLARAWGMSEAVIGLTIVGAGTSLPELATSLVAAVRGRPDIAVGNVVGSNIFNILGILGVTAVVSPPGAEGIRPVDLWVMGIYAAALLPLVWTGRRLERSEGALLLAGYAAYLWFLWPAG